MNWKLDRQLAISISEQIKGQITYAISCGALQAGETLPSVRELARKLGVSPVTVSKVYHELTEKGLLISKPYVGFFVNELGLDCGNGALASSHGSLNQILENSIRQAKFLGYSTDEIQDSFLSILEHSRNNQKKKVIIFAGIFTNATQHYAKVIAESLSDLNVQVMPLSIEKLLSELDQYADVLKSATLVVTLPQRISEVRNAIEPHYCKVVAIAFDISKITIQKLIAIRPEQKVGIVSTFPEYIHTMVNELAAYGLNIHPPLIALIAQEERVKEMLSKIDMLIYASGSDMVKEWAPKDLEMFEFLHTPKPESINRLRSLLEVETSHLQKNNAPPSFPGVKNDR